MLTQERADYDYLIKVLKVLKSEGKVISFPSPTQQEIIEAESDDLNQDKFMFYINRKGQYNLKKCTYQSRYNNTYNLLRIDINGPPHDNPDGVIVECPHIHIYKKGYNLSWAYPLNSIIETNPKDIDFLKYNNIKNKGDFYIREEGLI